MGNGGAKFRRRQTYLGQVTIVAAGNQGRLGCDPARAFPVRVGVSPTDIA